MAARANGLAAIPPSKVAIIAAPLPIVEAGVDRDRDPTERHGDEHPAQRVEIRHERQNGGLGLGQDVSSDLDPRRAQPTTPSTLPLSGMMAVSPRHLCRTPVTGVMVRPSGMRGVGST